MVTIVLADDHPVVRQGLRALLEGETDFNIVGEASDGLQAAKLIEDLRPDVAVLDLFMGNITGLEVIKQARSLSPGTCMLILSMYGEDCYVLEALRAGARAYVLKDATADELVHAIREVCCGRKYLSAAISQRAIDVYTGKDMVQDPYDRLSPREREVLVLITEGRTNSEIAERLCLSRRTIEAHRGNVMRKLHLNNTTDLLRYAIRRGILPPPG